MKTAYQRSSFGSIPGYSQNAVLQLIVATGVGFIAYLFTSVCFQAFSHDYPNLEAAQSVIRPFIAIPHTSSFLSHWWTLFTYGWVHDGFWSWITDVIWIYYWGTVLQSLIGYKQVIPVFVYGLLAGGLFYLAGQFIPYGGSPVYLWGSQAGIMALAAAAFTLEPSYRFFFGPNFSVPLKIVALIFVLLMAYSAHFNPAMLVWLAGGALAGFAYVRFLRNGYRPGEWAYELGERMERMAAPSEQAAWNREKRRRNQVLSRKYEPKQGISQRRIDEILEKIHQSGYNSLTKDEKEALLRASTEKD